MIRKFKCKECDGHGDIYTPPSDPYSQTEGTWKRCGSCGGQGFVEVDDKDEITPIENKFITNQE